MNFLRFPLKLLLAAGLALVTAGLGWLVFGVAGNRVGMRNLPDAEGSFIEVLSGTEAQLTLADAMAAPPAQWRRWNGVDYIRAPHGGAVWLRAILRNPGARPVHGVLADTEYFPDHVEAWMQEAPVHDDGLEERRAGSNPPQLEGWSHRISGEAVAGVDKPLWSRTATFPVTVPAGGERTIYLRADDYYFIYLRPRWWPRMEDWIATQLRNVVAEGLCWGGLMALWLYNVVLWARLRSSDIGCYVLYAGGALVFNFVSNGGLALLGLAAGSPGKEMIVAGSLAVSGLFMVQFGRIFLGTKATMPQMDRGLEWLRAVLIGLVVGVAAMPWMTGLHWLAATIVLLTLTHIALLIAAVLAWRRGVTHARFFILAFGMLFLSALPAVVTWLSNDILAWAARALLAGSMLEMLLLSFAVADRFAQTQRKLVEETEQRRMIEASYTDELQLEVEERTRELQAANADKDRMLTLLGHDLRSPLTAMTQTAEQLRRANESVSPAQLFAGEVADAGRQMLLLIEDVVLWSRLRIGDTPARGWHDAGLVVNQAVRLHRAQADRRQVEIAVTVAPGHAVQTDLVLAQALLRNLVGNAVKFARRRVTVSAERVGDAMRYTVRDDGPGLPPAVVERLRTAGAAGEERGFGLRLCREIAASLDVTIEVASPAGGGTEMGITLPARVASKPPMEGQP